MRRRLTLRLGRGALVAVYDALLFLMVAILVAEGMFLYTATSIGEGGQFSDGAYQRVCDAQLAMVEALSTTDALPTPEIGWSNGSSSSTLSLLDVTGPVEAETVGWLLASYCELTWRNGPGQDVWDGQWDTSAILPLVDAFLRGASINGTEQAWLFLYQGEVRLFGSSADDVDTVDDLPRDRWASSGDYTQVTGSGAQQSVKYDAELRYFLWYP